MSFKRILAFSLVLVTLLLGIPVASAYSSTPTSFWSTYLMRIVKGSSDVPMLGDAIQGLASNLSGAICELSSDGYHYADSLSGCSTGSDKNGMYALATCQYCNKEFKCYASDLSAAYDEFTNDVKTTLGTTAVGLNGIVIYPTLKSHSGYTNSKLQLLEHRDTWPYEFRFLLGYFSANDFPSLVYRYLFTFSAVAPVVGTYTGVCNVLSSENMIVDKIDLFSSGSYAVGKELVSSVAIYGKGPSNSYVSAVLDVHYEVVPYNYSVNEFTQNIGGIDSRVGSITGDYGILGDNGTIIKSDTQYIINETNNTYTNPATGETVPITNWTYDYSDRSYNVTTDSGNTTITYGDEYVTIKEGDTVYNIYYIMDGSDKPVDPDHKHEYTSTVTTAPTCKAPGLRTYTCSSCGHVYTEQIAPTGHTWAVKESVNTSYDENGELVQQGYTIYKCSVCGEEYKSTDGTAPPSGGGGSGGGDSGGTFSGIFGILWDFCSFFFGFFTDFVSGGIKGFLAAMLDGASGFFDLLNPVGWFT